MTLRRLSCCTRSLEGIVGRFQWSDRHQARDVDDEVRLDDQPLPLPSPRAPVAEQTDGARCVGEFTGIVVFFRDTQELVTNTLKKEAVSHRRAASGIWCAFARRLSGTR